MGVINFGDVEIVVCERYAKGFPQHTAREHDELTTTGPFEEACGETWKSDAHFTAYGCDAVRDRRLATPAAYAHLPEMRLFVVDVDGPDHKRTPDWWESEKAKLREFFKKYKRGYTYTTNGGYRIVWALKQPFVIDSATAAAKWSASYLTWLRLIEDECGIVGDAKCADPFRLFRLPRVCRDGKDVVPEEEHGRADRLLEWDEPYVEVAAVTASEPREVAVAAPVDDDRLELAADALVAAWPPRSRHYAGMALCGALAHAGWSSEAIADFVGYVMWKTVGDPEIAKWSKQADNVIEKIARGENVTGWPKLEDHMVTGADAQPNESRRDSVRVAIDSARRSLGMGPAIELFAMVRAQATVVEAPTLERVRSTVEAATMRLSRSTDATKKHDGNLLKRVLKHEIITEPTMLAEAALAVARCAPPGTTNEQVDALFGWVAGGAVRDDVKGAIANAMTTAEGERRASEEATSADGFVATAEKYIREHRTTADGVVSLRRWRGGWYEWTAERGCYREVGDEELDRELYRKCSIGNRKDVGDQRHALIAVDDVLIERAELGSWLDGTASDPLDVVACRNGLVHIPTGAIQPTTPAYFTTSCAGAAYDPSAPAPTLWLKFLDEVFPDDSTAIATMQEVMGYLLTPDTRQHKLFLLLGLPRSGKGTVARVLVRLLGEGNVVAPTLASLATNFGLAPLIGKPAAIVGDARLAGRTSGEVSQILERLLSISGEDSQTIDRKYREAWVGTMPVRFVILTNELPKVPDASGALTDRTILMHFQETFLGREDTELTGKLLAELPGILAWAIEGWRRLRARARFIQPASSTTALDQLRALGNPTGAWIRDTCDVGPELEVATKDAYASYRRWCADRGIPPKSEPEFGVEIAAMGHRRRKPRVDGKQVPHYAGFAPARPDTPAERVAGSI